MIPPMLSPAETSAMHKRVMADTVPSPGLMRSSWPSLAVAHLRSVDTSVLISSPWLHVYFLDHLMCC